MKYIELLLIESRDLFDPICSHRGSRDEVGPVRRIPPRGAPPRAGRAHEVRLAAGRDRGGEAAGPRGRVRRTVFCDPGAEVRGRQAGQTSEGSFSAGLAPIFASEYYPVNSINMY